MKSTLIFISLILIIVFTSTPSHALWWMVYHKHAFKGKVIDAETKETIEGAVVVVTYSKHIFRFMPESGSVIMDVRETLTDKDGIFSIPSYTTMIDPLAWEGMAKFIIFKPGYDCWQGFQSLPYGIRPIDEEIFFSREIGSKGELEMWEKGGPPPVLKRSKVTFGIVELPKLKTREERLNNLRSIPPSDIAVKWPHKIQHLIKLSNEERVSLGGKPLFVPMPQP